MHILYSIYVHGKYHFTDQISDKNCEYRNILSDGVDTILFALNGIKYIW